MKFERTTTLRTSPGAWVPFSHTHPTWVPSDNVLVQVQVDLNHTQMKSNWLNSLTFNVFTMCCRLLGRFPVNREMVHFFNLRNLDSWIYLFHCRIMSRLEEANEILVLMSCMFKSMGQKEQWVWALQWVLLQAFFSQSDRPGCIC
jgi:hypothetical protein